MVEIIKEILKHLPDGIISDSAFEGANIVLYTKDKDFFLNDKGEIKKVVNLFKKRVELRPDPAICMGMEEAEIQIRQIIPQEASVTELHFEPQRSYVTITTEKPGLAIGKQGSLLREIREKTLWIPSIDRTPAIKSQIIDNIRSVLYEHNDFRRKFLNQTGHRIYDDWKRGKQQGWVRVTHLGAARQVGRSAILVQTHESRILMDCGIDVASRDNAYPMLESPDFNINDLDAVVISHSHLDHIGFVPYLFKYGYRGPVYLTAPTRDVGSLLLLDYVKIMKNELGKSIYETEDIKEFVKHTITLNWGEVTDITPDVRLTFYNSGHILGSSMIHLNIGNGLHNLVYTADMKYGKSPLLDRANTEFPRMETVIIESTYGGKDNVLPQTQSQDDLLKDSIIKTINSGGQVLMPVLGSGRAQDMMVIIERMIRTGEMPEIPVYIDGMVWDVTAIHTAYPEFLNSAIRKQIFQNDQNPFLAPFFKRIGSAKERKEVLENTGPCIIMATSGMLIGGPSVEYLKNMASNPKNLIIFSCYQSEGSLGKKIRDGEKDILLGTLPNGKHDMLHIKMDVLKIEISDHSDRRELMNFLHKCSPRPKRVIVNHGEQSRCLDLASSVYKTFRVESVCPKNLDAIRLV